MIELRNIKKSYISGHYKIEAIKGISLKVSNGDFIVVKGPSGSGKSTLLNIIGLLDQPNSGEVLLENAIINYKDFDKLADLRSQKLSFIFQSFNLNPVLTLEENVMVPLMIRQDIAKKEKLRRVAEWIENVGLTSHRQHKPDELSGGQRQRVAIARAMVSQPQLVIADEPTANLDSITTRSILSLMKQLNEKKNVAFIFATHDPELQEYAKKTIIIKDGLLAH